MILCIASSESITMAPGISDTPLPVRSAPRQYPAPLKKSGALDKFSFEETTPAIGREYPTTNIVDDLLNAENADELVRDLAITSKNGPNLTHWL